MKGLYILLVEDDQIEIMKLGRLLKKISINHRLVIANNGEEALTLLNSNIELPDIIFLENYLLFWGSFFSFYLLKQLKRKILYF